MVSENHIVSSKAAMVNSGISIQWGKYLTRNKEIWVAISDTLVKLGASRLSSYGVFPYLQHEIIKK